MRNDPDFVIFENTAANKDWTLAELTAALPNMVTLYWGECAAGYICLEGCTKRRPQDLGRDNGFPCPKGYFCEQGETEPMPCAPGTYQDELG